MGCGLQLSRTYLQARRVSIARHVTLTMALVDLRPLKPPPSPDPSNGSHQT
jgi:hypothetical protein